MADAPLLQIRNLAKSYGGVHAVCDVSMDIAAGEVHALCGENGAGKSTLIKILTGVVIPDSGQVEVRGRRLLTGSVAAAEEAGIAVMHQESTAFPDLNAIDNLFVGRELTRQSYFLDHARMRQRAEDLFDRLGESIDLRQPLGQMSVAQRQLVAMARALLRDCQLLIMDEPTASLSAKETTVLLRLIEQLRHSGVSVLYVSHRLEEVFEISDRVTVLRDGRWVATTDTADLSQPELIQQMVGREVDELTRRHGHYRAVPEVALEVRGLTRRNRFYEVSFSVSRGEVVGLAGLVGAGRSEVARAIFGIDNYDAGKVLVNGHPLRPGSVAAAVKAGLALVPEDRQHEGLVLPMTVGANLSLAVLKRLRRWGLVHRQLEQELIANQMEHLQVKAAGADAAASTLSGGNQQKLVLGKWLASEPEVLILDEPTRGVDVGAKSQVHRLIRQLTAAGIATLIISSELPELLTIADRILVMREGRLVGELPGATAEQTEVLRLALPDGQAALVRPTSSQPKSTRG